MQLRPGPDPVATTMTFIDGCLVLVLYRPSVAYLKLLFSRMATPTHKRDIDDDGSVEKLETREADMENGLALLKKKKSGTGLGW